MKIKKIDFPSVEDVLCLDCGPIGANYLCTSLDNGDEWRVCVDQLTGYYIYVISWFLGGCWVRDSEELRIGGHLLPSEANSRVREWYKNACTEMQKAFENYVFENYFEKGDDND